jgi:hypothetical protein
MLLQQIAELRHAVLIESDDASPRFCDLSRVRCVAQKPDAGAFRLTRIHRRFALMNTTGEIGQGPFAVNLQLSTLDGEY